MRQASLELSLVPIVASVRDAVLDRATSAPAASTASAELAGSGLAHRRPGRRTRPGWFMSSWELERGLEVRDGWPGDRGVHEWIDGFLKVRSRGSYPPRVGRVQQVRLRAAYDCRLRQRRRA